MIRLEDSGLKRDGTRWRRHPRLALRKSGIFPYPGEVYHGLGPANVTGYLFVEVEGYVSSVHESEVELVEGEPVRDR